MRTEIFVIDDDATPAVNGHWVPRGSGGHWADISRRLRRLGATVNDVASLSARLLPSAYLGEGSDLRPAAARPELRSSHLHVHSSGAALRQPEAADTARMLVRRDRTAATVSYEVKVDAVKGGLSTADLTSIESMIGCSDVVTMSERALGSLRRGERHADAVRWLMARGPAIITVTDDLGGYVGYVRGGSVVHSRRATDVVATRGVSAALAAGLLSALDERCMLGADAYEALRRIDLREAREVFSDANRHGGSATSLLGSALPRQEVELGA
jgi:hypothetical protein